MKDSSLVIWLVSLIAGILCAKFAYLSPVSAVPFVIGGITIFTYGIYKTKKREIATAGKANLISSILLMGGIGIFSMSMSLRNVSTLPQGEYLFSGTVIDYTPTSSGEKSLVNFSTLQLLDKNSKTITNIPIQNINGLITIRDVSMIDYGSKVSGKVHLQPLDAKGNFRNDDYMAYLKSKDIIALGYTTDNAVVVNGESISLFPVMHRLRDRLEAGVEKSSLSSPAKAFIISVALGDRSYLTMADRQQFADAGISHIFAVSGMHVGMLAMFILVLLSLFLKDKARKWKFLIPLPLIWFYVLLTGASPSTIRAGVMLTIGLTAMFLQRKNLPIVTLLWAVLLILCFNPKALFDIGFQLSVVCVGSLILLSQPLNFIHHRSHPRLYKVVSLVSVTLIATFSSWIICAFYFHRFSIMFLPANIVAVPLLPVYLILAIIYFLFWSCGIDIGFLADILSWSYEKFLVMVEFFNSLSVPIKNINISLPSVFLWLTGIGLLAYYLYKERFRSRWWIPSAFFLAALCLIPFAKESMLDGFIIQKNSEAITVVGYSGNDEVLHTFEPGTVSSINFSGRKIIAIDRDPGASLSDLNLRESDIIILGNGIGDEIYNLRDKIAKDLAPNTKVMLHPSIHWRREKKLREESPIPLYSLRYDGPYHYFTEDPTD